WPVRAVVVFHEAQCVTVVSSPTCSSPSCLLWAPAALPLSHSLPARRSSDLLTVAPEAGEVMEAVGGMVSAKEGVVAPTMLDRSPKTAAKFRIPLKAASCKWSRAGGTRPRTVHDLVAPMVVPRRGAEHVSEDT